MGFLETLTDDQLAILGCLGAMLGCALLMSLSYYFGRPVAEERTVALADVAEMPRIAGSTSEAHREQRKAA